MSEPDPPPPPPNNAPSENIADNSNGGGAATGGKKRKRKAKPNVLRFAKGKRVVANKGNLWWVISEAQRGTFPADCSQRYQIYGVITGGSSTAGYDVAFDTFPADDKTVAVTSKRLTVIPRGSEEPAESARDRKKRLVSTQPHTTHRASLAHPTSNRGAAVWGAASDLRLVRR